MPLETTQSGFVGVINAVEKAGEAREGLKQLPASDPRLTRLVEKAGEAREGFL